MRWHAQRTHLAPTTLNDADDMEATISLLEEAYSGHRATHSETLNVRGTGYEVGMLMSVAHLFGRWRR
jgi:hypothetical protein